MPKYLYFLQYERGRKVKGMKETANNDFLKIGFPTSKTGRFGQKENEKNRNSSIRRKGLKVEVFSRD
jgi:hypothetical protein